MPNTRSTDIESMKSSLLQGQVDMASINASIQKEQAAAAEFRTLVLGWMKEQERRPGTDGSSSSGSVLPPLTPNPPPSPSRKPLHTNPQSTEWQFDIPNPPPSFGNNLMFPPSSAIPWATKKVKLPEFHGFDPQGWLQKALLYFEIGGITSDLRLGVAQLCMTGVATHWFTILQQSYHPLSWELFQSEFLKRFSGLEIRNPYEQLATMKQGDSIYDYIDEFEYLLSLVPQLPESQSIGYFIAGLKEDVKKWVHIHRPNTRLDAMVLAKDIENLLHPVSHAPSQIRFRYNSGSPMGLVPGGGTPRDLVGWTDGTHHDPFSLHLSHRPRSRLN
ncbi:hypothetical protein OROGR_001030 [Orobanche gracilis]